MVPGARKASTAWRQVATATGGYLHRLATGGYGLATGGYGLATGGYGLATGGYGWGTGTAWHLNSIGPIRETYRKRLLCSPAGLFLSFLSFLLSLL
jgi:hypothetical protein